MVRNRPSGLRVTQVAAPVREQVVRGLRSAIVAGVLGKPGDKLIERELCELTSASRTSVREALRQLEAEGLVTSIPHRGTVISELTRQSAIEIYQIRAALEGLAGELFAINADDAEIEALTEAVGAIEVHLYRSDADVDLQEAIDEFYDVLFEGCGNRLVKTMTQTIHARISLLRRTTLSQPDRARKSLGEVRAIAEAAAARDPEMMKTACVQHVRQAAEVALAALPSLEADGSRLNPSDVDKRDKAR